MFNKSCVKEEKCWNRKYFNKKISRKILSAKIHCLNLYRFKFKAVLGLTAVVLFAYVYILSLFFQHTLSHLLIVTLSSLHITSCYQHFSILQFFYLLVLVFLSDVNREKSSDSTLLIGQSRQNVLYQKWVTLRNYAKLTTERFLIYFLKKLKRSIFKVYESIKDLMEYFTKTEKYEDMLNMNNYEILNESSSDVRMYDVAKYCEDVSCYEDNTCFDINHKANIEMNILNMTESKCTYSYMQRKSFFHIHRKRKKIKTVSIEPTDGPTKPLIYLVYYCKVIPTNNFVIESNASFTTSKRNMTTSISNSINTKRPVYKMDESGGSAIWLDENKMPVKDFDIIASKLSAISNSSDVGPDQWDSVKSNFKGLNTKAVKLAQATTKKVLKKIPWLQSKSYVIYDAPTIAPVPRPVKVAPYRPPKVTLASAHTEKMWFKMEYEKHIGAPPNAGKNQKSREGMINEAVNSLRCCGRYQLVWERCSYKPAVPIKPLQPIDWQKAPLALKCICPKAECICKGNTLLPKTKIPFVFRHDYGGIHEVLSCCGLYRPKPAKAFPEKLLKAVNEESHFYKSPEGRTLLEEKGPEFCMSGCVHFFASNKKMTKNLVQELKKKKQEMPPPPPPPKPQKPQKIKKQRKKEADDFTFERPAETQAYTNKDGEFIIGRYSHIIYPSLNEAIVRDITGTLLQISSYQYEPPPPFLDQIGFIAMKESVKQSISNTGKKIKYRAFGLGGDKYADKETQYDYNDMDDGIPEAWGSYQDALQKFNESKWISKGSSYKCCEYDKRLLSHEVIPEANESDEEPADFIRLPEYVVNEPPPNKLHSFVDSLIKRICEKKSVDGNMMGDSQHDSIYRPLTIGSNSNSSSSTSCVPWEYEAQGDQSSNVPERPSLNPEQPNVCCDKTIDDKRNDITEVTAEKVGDLLNQTDTASVKQDLSTSDDKGNESALKPDNKVTNYLGPTKINTENQTEKVVLSARTSTESAMWLAPPESNNLCIADSVKKPNSETIANSKSLVKPASIVKSYCEDRSNDSYTSRAQQNQPADNDKDETHDEPGSQIMRMNEESKSQNAVENTQTKSLPDNATSPLAAEVSVIKSSNANLAVEDKKSNIETVNLVLSKESETLHNPNIDALPKSVSGEIVVQCSDRSIANKSDEKYKTKVGSDHSRFEKNDSNSSKRKLHLNEPQETHSVKSDFNEKISKHSIKSKKSKRSPSASCHKEDISLSNLKGKSEEIMKNEPRNNSNILKNQCSKGSIDKKPTEAKQLIEKNLSAIYLCADQITSSQATNKPSSKLKAKMSSAICNSKQRIKKIFSKDSKISRGVNINISKNVIDRGCDAVKSRDGTFTACCSHCKSQCSEKKLSMDSVRKYYRFYW